MWSQSPPRAAAASADSEQQQSRQAGCPAAAALQDSKRRRLFTKIQHAPAQVAADQHILLSLSVQDPQYTSEHGGPAAPAVPVGRAAAPAADLAQELAPFAKRARTDDNSMASQIVPFQLPQQLQHQQQEQLQQHQQQEELLDDDAADLAAIAAAAAVVAAHMQASEEFCASNTGSALPLWAADQEAQGAEADAAAAAAESDAAAALASAAAAVEALEASAIAHAGAPNVSAAVETAEADAAAAEAAEPATAASDAAAASAAAASAAEVVEATASAPTGVPNVCAAAEAPEATNVERPAAAAAAAVAAAESSTPLMAAAAAAVARTSLPDAAVGDTPVAAAAGAQEMTTAAGWAVAAAAALFWNVHSGSGCQSPAAAAADAHPLLQQADTFVAAAEAAAGLDTAALFGYEDGPVLELPLPAALDAGIGALGIPAAVGPEGVWLADTLLPHGYPATAGPDVLCGPAAVGTDGAWLGVELLSGGCSDAAAAAAVGAGVSLGSAAVDMHGVWLADQLLSAGSPATTAGAAIGAVAAVEVPAEGVWLADELLVADCTTVGAVQLPPAATSTAAASAAAAAAAAHADMSGSGDDLIDVMTSPCSTAGCFYLPTVSQEAAAAAAHAGPMLSVDPAESPPAAAGPAAGPAAEPAAAAAIRKLFGSSGFAAVSPSSSESDLQWLAAAVMSPTQSYSPTSAAGEGASAFQRGQFETPTAATVAEAAAAAAQEGSTCPFRLAASGSNSEDAGATPSRQEGVCCFQLPPAASGYAAAAAAASGGAAAPATAAAGDSTHPMQRRQVLLPGTVLSLSLLPLQDTSTAGSRPGSSGQGCQAGSLIQQQGSVDAVIEQQLAHSGSGAGDSDVFLARLTNCQKSVLTDAAAAASGPGAAAASSSSSSPARQPLTPSYSGEPQQLQPCAVLQQGQGQRRADGHGQGQGWVQPCPEMQQDQSQALLLPEYVVLKLRGAAGDCGNAAPSAPAASRTDAAGARANREDLVAATKREAGLLCRLAAAAERRGEESMFAECFGYAVVQAVQAAACREAGGSSTQCQQQQQRQDQQQRQQGEQVLGEVSCGTSSALVGSPCLLLHWCEGGSLQQRLEPSPGLHVPLSARGTWQVLRAAHTALCQAHDASILLASLTPSNVLVCKEGTPGYRDGNGYRLCGLSSALQPSGLDCVESALVDGGSSDAFAAPDRYYSVFSETWKLGVLLLACRMGQAVTPPNGSCLADVLSDEVCRGLRLEPVELQLMQLCFASLGERHPPKRLAEFTSYFDAATFDLLLDSV